MNTLSKIVLGACMLTSTLTYALDATSLSANWVCSTNASTSANDVDRIADRQMIETSKPASDAFSFAAQNCRDCTKITCTLK